MAENTEETTEYESRRKKDEKRDYSRLGEMSAMTAKELYGVGKQEDAKMFFGRTVKIGGFQPEFFFKLLMFFYLAPWFFFLYLAFDPAVNIGRDFVVAATILEPVFVLIWFVTRSSDPIQFSSEGILQGGDRVRWSAITKIDYAPSKPKITVYSNTGRTLTFSLKRASSETKKGLGASLERRATKHSIAFSQVKAENA